MTENGNGIDPDDRSMDPGFLDNAPDGAFIDDLKGIILYGNRKLEEMTGYRGEEVIGKNFLELNLLSDDGLEKVAEIMRANINGRSTGPDELDVLKKDGSRITVEASTSLVRYLGKTSVLAFVRDITARKLMEKALRESEEKHGSLIQHLSNPIFVFNTDETYRFVNEAFATPFGKKPEEIIGKSPHNIFPHDEAEKRLTLVRRVLATGERGEIEVKVVTHTGEVRYYLTEVDPIRDGQGVVQYLYCSSRETTKRKLAEDAISRAKKEWEDTFDAMPDMIALIDPEHRIIRANAAMAKRFGKTPAQMVGCLCHEVVHNTAFPPDSCPHVKLLASGKEEHAEVVDERLGGTFEVSTTPLRNEAGQLTGCIHVARDITDRRRAGEAMRASEEKYRNLVDNANEAILVAQDGRLKFINRKAPEMIGYSEEKLTSTPFTDFIHPDDRAMVVEIYKKRLNGESVLPDRYTFRFITAGGVVRWVEIGSVRIEWQGRPAVLNFLTDITERKQAEEELQKLAAVVRNSSELINLATFEGKMIFCNEAGARIIGISQAEVENTSIMQVIPAHLRDKVENELLPALYNNGKWSGELQYRNIRTGKLTDVHARCFVIENPFTGAPWCMANISTDITELKRHEEEKTMLADQLQQSMKMEAVGRLAGGVAHDFNNLLTGITGNVSVALMDLKPDDPLYEILVDVNKAAYSAAALTRQLLAFSRRQIIEPKVLDLNELVTNLHKMLIRLIGEDVDLKTVPGEALGAVRADPGQIEQVIINLAVNARDSMPGGGKLEIETANVELDEEYCRTHANVQPGNYVMLAVSDTGEGMSREVKEHLFEPFFTT
ncbi:MAG: PAS domain S-box protein, partial [Desulfobaccales bacterium]